MEWTMEEFDDCAGYDCMTGGFVIKAKGRKFVVDLAEYGQDSDGTPPTDEQLVAAASDARLISAAPNMLEALQYADDRLGTDSEIWQKVRAAIAKATQA